jgi:alpha-1,3-mannosyl-glycoprotein beta-1,2-N-acetylglucosaminyltransferase
MIFRNAFTSRLLILGAILFSFFIILNWLTLPSAIYSEEILKIVLQKTDQIFLQLAKLERMIKDIQAPKAIVKNIQQTSSEVKKPVEFKPVRNAQIGVLVLACNRVTVSRALDSLLKHRSSKERFPIVVSQDCNHEPTSAVLDKYTMKGDIVHVRHPDNSQIIVPKAHERFAGHYHVARHYKFALSQVFDAMGFEQAIVVEDDMEVSPDFFDYFAAFLPLLREDRSLLCVSSWNDNGKYSNSSNMFYRSDFFPGLGLTLFHDTNARLDAH